jgi:hypothetical protein
MATVAEKIRDYLGSAGQADAPAWRGVLDRERREG